MMEPIHPFRKRSGRPKVLDTAVLLSVDVGNKDTNHVLVLSRPLKSLSGARKTVSWIRKGSRFTKEVPAVSTATEWIRHGSRLERRRDNNAAPSLFSRWFCLLDPSDRF